MADSSAQAADRLRRMAFEGVVEVAVHVYAIMEQIGDAPGPLVQQLVLRTTDSFVVGQGVAVVADEADMEGKARAGALGGGLPVGKGIRLTCAFDDDKTDLAAPSGSGRMRSVIRSNGPDFDRQRNFLRATVAKPVDEIRQAASVAAAGKTSDGN